MDEVLLTVTNLSKVFTPSYLFKKKGLEVFKNVSFELMRGSCLGVIGPNGVGKTTLIKIIAGLIIQTDGEIAFLSQPVTNYSKAMKKKIGLAGSEERSFFWRLSAYDNLDFFGSLYEIPKDTRGALIDSLLQLFNLYEYRKKLFVYLSSGMRQKLILIRAIMHNPELLLLDEPLKNLDMQSKNIFLHWVVTHMKERNLSAIFISHELEDLLKVADRIALMENNSFTIFESEQIKTIAAKCQRVKLKVRDHPAMELIKVASCSVTKCAEFCEIVVGEPSVNNNLKQLIDELWTHKIEVISLEIMPPGVENIMQMLKMSNTRGKIESEQEGKKGGKQDG